MTEKANDCRHGGQTVHEWSAAWCPPQKPTGYIPPGGAWTAEESHLDETRIYHEPGNKLMVVRSETVRFVRESGGAFYYLDAKGDEFHTTEPLPEVPEKIRATVAALVAALEDAHKDDTRYHYPDGGQIPTGCPIHALLDAVKR